mmetsp:Transcript_62851/g.149886  ORF Transcript_62851/g.149886 Transcript_62851/m.149886 type:complete len:175 (-) Transcript_62851:177-701(-)
MFLRSRTSLASLLCIAVSLSGCLGGQEPKCSGPIQPQLLYGCQAEEHRNTADDICCHNSMFAERSGLLVELGLFGQLDSNGVTTFYDSVCGRPLFRAPVGRTFQEWKAESEHHGWPSFRDAEVVKDNIKVFPDGEVQSSCGVHLGHNLPDDKGDRYCIDLVCIAGKKNETLITS